MKFKSRKDILFQVIGFGCISLLLGIIFFRLFSDGIENYVFMWHDLLLLAVTAFLLWSGFGTNYELTTTELKYKSGPIRGKIEIKKIKEIIKGKTMWSGFKPATARNGLLIKYDMYHEIYISPKTNDAFINKILEINDKIQITAV